jgi:Flp pilus assembly pilin Flp
MGGDRSPRQSEDVLVWKTIRAHGMRLARAERGQTNVEYALILLLIALATILLLAGLASQTTSMLTSVANSINP